MRSTRDTRASSCSPYPRRAAAAPLLHTTPCFRSKTPKISFDMSRKTARSSSARAARGDGRPRRQGAAQGGTGRGDAVRRPDRSDGGNGATRARPRCPLRPIYPICPVCPVCPVRHGHEGVVLTCSFAQPVRPRVGPGPRCPAIQVGIGASLRSVEAPATQSGRSHTEGQSHTPGRTLVRPGESSRPWARTPAPPKRQRASGDQESANPRRRASARTCSTASGESEFSLTMARNRCGTSSMKMPSASAVSVSSWKMAP